MKRFQPFAAVLILALCVAGSALAAPERVPYVISDDFETGELYGWESYPYAQDIGYEPFTIPQREPAHNGSQFSLAKIQKPNDVVELYEGFTKQLDLWTIADTRFKCAVFLMSDRRAADLELSICLLDGRRYFHHVTNAEANRWLELDIPLGGFTKDGKTLESGQQVQAVTIKAFYPIVSHLMSYTICIDDFSLNGERPRRFVGVDPPSTTFEMFGFSVLHKHFFYGDTVALTVKPEDASGSGAPSAVTCDLLDPSGKTIVSGLAMNSSGDAWSANKVYTFKPDDPRGQWTINFSGKGAGGGDIAWGLRFIMPGDKLTAQDRPRVMLGKTDLQQLKADTSPDGQRLLASLASSRRRSESVDINEINEVKATQSEALTGGPYAMGIGGGRAGRGGGASRLASIALSGAERYAFAGDEAAGVEAKQALLKLSSYSKWNTDWHEAHGMHMYYPIASSIIGPAAEALDLIHPLLSAEERAAIREGFMRNAILPFHRDMVEQNRMPSSLSNHIAVIVTGMAKAATALYGDDPENPYLEPYFSGILAKTKQFVDRTYYRVGGYGEPTTYQDMASRDMVEAFHVLETNFGIDYTTTTHFKDTWLYPLYVTYSNGRYPDFGDVSPSYNLSGNVFRWLSHRTQNPYTYYFVKQADESGRSRGGLLSRLWTIEGVTPRSREELVPSHMFPDKGNMVMRSGWSDEDTVMIFKAGPNSNHYHVDQGTFYLMANGEELISDAGHGSSYYANLYYPGYYTQPIGHNVMLIDNDAESQIPADYENGVVALRDYPRMLHSFAGWKTAGAEGNLTCVYKGKVQSYTRSLLYMKPDILFLYDKVKSSEPHTYSWLFHAEHTDGKSSISGEGNSIDITRSQSSLHMDVLTPEIESSRVRTSDRDESFITLSGAPDTKDTEFLAVLIPSASKVAPAPSDKPVSTLLNPEGWTGAKVQKGEVITLAFFRKGAPGAATAEGFTTDAERFSTVSDTQGNLRQFFLRGSSIARAGNILFQSAQPISISAAFIKEGVDIETESESATEINLRTEPPPASVALNDQPVNQFQYDAQSGMLKLSVPAGHAIVKVR